MPAFTRAGAFGTVLAALLALLSASCTEKVTHKTAAVPMLVAGVSPSAGPAAGGTSVTVYGTFFAAGASVTFGGAPATSVTVIDETRLTCLTPAGPAGAAAVVVTSPGSGSAALAGGFTYTDWPYLAWTRKAAFTVTPGASSAVDGYQVRVTVPYDTDMKSDFGDLRFSGTDAAGVEAEAPFWVESFTASTQAQVWVRVPHIPAAPGTATVYVFYGNPSAVSASDFDSAFDKDFGDAGLAGLWHFDEGSGLEAADSAGGSSAGTLRDFSPPYGWTPSDGGGWGGRSDVGFGSGSALALDGREAYADLGPGSGLNPASALSVECWAKASASSPTGREQVLVAKWALDGSGFANRDNWKSFDAGGEAWYYKASLPAGYFYLSAAAAGGRIYTCGGIAAGITAAVNMYNPGTNSWTPVASLPSARYLHTCAALDGRIYCIGGFVSGASTETWVYNPPVNSWKRLANMNTARAVHACAVYNGKIYVFGGYDGANPIASVEEYDPTKDTWMTKTPMNVARCEQAAVALNGKIYVVGGRSSSTLDTVEEYSPSADTWTTKNTLPAARSFLAAAEIHGKAYVFGGYDLSGMSLNSVLEYVPASDSWTPVDSMQTARQAFACAVLDGRIYVLGGSPGPTSSVEAYNPGLDLAGVDPDGYSGAIFDGRYVYFVPYHNGSAPHGLVLRYDSAGTFGDSRDWSAFDAAAALGADVAGYSGAAFDGRRVYFVPQYNGAGSHGKVLMYDTSGAFDAAGSWSAFDPAVGTYSEGMSGACFDGRYVYFMPLYNDAYGYNGEFVRYDTTLAFNQDSSWTAFDPGSAGLGIDPDGYAAAVFDGRYIYATPLHNGTDAHGEVVRFDTKGPFDQVSSWRAFDPGSAGVGTDPDGYVGGAFDGRYVYFVPRNNGSVDHTEILRYDTDAEFTAATSWDAFDPRSAGVGTTGALQGAMFDGRFVYFAPLQNSEIYRLDTMREFDSAAAWSVVDLVPSGFGHLPRQFSGVVSDGRHAYFAPMAYGEVLRFDFTGAKAAYKLAYSQQDMSGGLSGNPNGFTAVLCTDEGTFTACENAVREAGEWHHVAMAYDGSLLSLYVDGALADSAAASGKVLQTAGSLCAGSVQGSRLNFNGSIDEVRVYSRALPSGEVLAHCQRRKYVSPEPVVSGPGAEETK